MEFKKTTGGLIMQTKEQTPDFIYATYIRTTPEKLWEALTNGDFSEQYWMGHRVEVEQRAGGRIRIAPPQGVETPCGDHTGKVLACEPGRKLVYEFVVTDPPEVAAKRNGPSRVTYELTPMGDQVRLLLIHENLLSEDTEKDPNNKRGINNGWPAILSSLKSLLETGKAIPFAVPAKDEAKAATR
jgi:uncharacterized protein YndB with AHSA1/START domain